MKYSFARGMAFTLLLLSSAAQAQLAVNRIIVDFTPDTPPREDVILHNSSEDETLFVNVEVLEVSDPGTENEQRIVVDDPSKIGLIATPTRVVLPPNTRRQVRLVNMLDGNKEDRIFRVNFTPVVGELESDTNAVKIMVGYQALVIVRPDRPSFNLTSKRDGNTLVLNNEGNTNIYLEQVRQCQSNNTDECTPLNERRLYAGNSYAMDIEEEGAVLFNVYDGSKRTSTRL